MDLADKLAEIRQMIQRLREQERVLRLRLIASNGNAGSRYIVTVGHRVLLKRIAPQGRGEQR